MAGKVCVGDKSHAHNNTAWELSAGLNQRWAFSPPFPPKQVDVRKYDPEMTTTM